MKVDGRSDNNRNIIDDVTSMLTSSSDDEGGGVTDRYFAFLNWTDDLQQDHAGMTSVESIVWQSVVFGLLAAVTSLITIGGNLIVILSFIIERTIRQPSNYFIASLAVSDLLIGTISMPLYSVYILTDKNWPFGEVLCDLWLSLDYTACLCSIYTVFCITVDRFCSIRLPARYRTWRTERKVLTVVCMTWAIPIAVFFTSIIGWQYFAGRRTVPSGKCYVQYMEDALFNCVLQVGYFWITLTAMIALYTGIYRVALDLHRRSEDKRRKHSTSLAAMAQQTVAHLGTAVIGITRPAHLDIQLMIQQQQQKHQQELDTQLRSEVTASETDKVLQRAGRQRSRSQSIAAAVNRNSVDRDVNPGLSSSSESSSDCTSLNRRNHVRQIGNHTSATGLTLRPPTSRVKRLNKLKQQQQQPRLLTDATVSRSRTQQRTCRLPVVLGHPTITEASAENSGDSARNDHVTLPGASKKVNEAVADDYCTVASTEADIQTSRDHLPIKYGNSSAAGDDWHAEKIKPDVELPMLSILLAPTMVPSRRRKKYATWPETTRNSRASGHKSRAHEISAFASRPHANGCSNGKATRRQLELPVQLTRFDAAAVMNKTVGIHEPETLGIQSSELSVAICRSTGNITAAGNGSGTDVVTRRGGSIQSSSDGGTLDPSSSCTRETTADSGAQLAHDNGLQHGKIVDGKNGSRRSWHRQRSSVGSHTASAIIRAAHAGVPASAPAGRLLLAPPCVNASSSIPTSPRPATTATTPHITASAFWNLIVGRTGGRAALSESERRKRKQQKKNENRAKKALRTITIILGAFVICWTPWHVLSLLIGFCGGGDGAVLMAEVGAGAGEDDVEMELGSSCVPTLIYDISYWLCYLNSPINPFCYAFVNQQFKKTFIRILRLDWHRT